MTLLQEMDLRKLNSMTKYPSIPTYHLLGEKGALMEQRVELPETGLIATEKVDGTNSRIICLPDNTYVIGSREELLHAKGDVIWNPALGIVDTLKPVADTIVSSGTVPSGVVYVFYLEVFGGKVTASSKQYTGERRVGYRMFDVARLDESEARLEKPIEELAQWRDNGGQTFLAEDELKTEALKREMELTPRIAIDGVPEGHEQVLNWLEEVLPETRCRLDGKADGKPEGVVVRTYDRRTIVKIRYEDYQRHMRRLTKQRC